MGKNTEKAMFLKNYNIAVAYHVLKNDYEQLDALKSCPSEEPNPETLLIKKDLAEKLGNLAKEMISLVLEPNNEFLRFCSMYAITQEKVTKRKLYDYLRLKGKRHSEIKRAIQQITELVKEF